MFERPPTHPIAAITSPGFTYLGCYNDFFGGWRMLPLLLSASGVDGIGVNSSCMTIELCGYIAQNQGFTYFGVEEGTREHSAEGRGGNLATPGPFSSGCSTCLILELFPSPPPLMYAHHLCSVLCW